MKSDFSYSVKGTPVKESLSKSGTVPYDKRSGIYMSQGQEYGVGEPAKFGTKATSSKSAIPEGAFCFKYEA